MSNTSPDALSSSLEQLGPLPPALQVRFLRHSWLVAIVLLLVASGTGVLGGWWLLRQPDAPNCRRVVWPFASASLRFYCAQDAAQTGTLEGLFRAMAIVESLPENHPLRPMINDRIDVWAKQALNLAEEEFHDGNLDRAIRFAERLPSRTVADAQVKERIKTWRKVWAQGRKIYEQAEGQLKQEEWRKAFSTMVQLLSVDNRYWSKQQYEALYRRIIQAQKDELVIVKARRLARSGGIDNLLDALEMVQNLPESSIFQPSVRKLVTQISKSLVQVAAKALEAEDLNTALDALEHIPEDVAFWPQVQDWRLIANAMSETWSGTVEGFEAAIAQLEAMAPNRPLYARAQTFVARWQADITYVSVLNDAEAMAADGSIPSLTAAIAHASQIPRSSSVWELSADQIDQWQSSLHYQESLARIEQDDETWQFSANTESAPAIAAPEPVDPSPVATPESEPTTSPRATEAQRLLQEAQRLAAKGTPSALAAAMETAHQVPVPDLSRETADASIESWSYELLEMARSRATFDLAGAITIAQQMPSFTAAYDESRQQIADWQAALDAQ